MRISVIFFTVVFLASCSPVRKLGLKKAFEITGTKFQDHTGFMLYDLDKKKSVYEYNASKYFTPASNTKIFTFYTSLRILGDSIPALKYLVRNDSLIFWGTGDPSFLYKYTFDNGRVYNFLKSVKEPLYFSNSNFFDEHFGPGWAWDDYKSAYSPERSSFPVFGNIFTLKKNENKFELYPAYFQKLFSVGERRTREEVVRDLSSNFTKFHPGTGRTKNPPEWDIPMRVDQELTTRLLSDTLKRMISSVKLKAPPALQPLFSIRSDSLYRVMMQDSDNFIAEQLLLICSNVVRDSMKTEIAIAYSKENFLSDLPDEPIWVDGSGLSRYNLFTPRSIVRLWEKIYEAVPRERLFSLLATGGKKGTIKNWYKSDQPYIFGKTGSLSNNHTLSGFLITKSGKTLIFSFMNNNFIATTSEIRKNMQLILNTIYEKY